MKSVLILGATSAMARAAANQLAGESYGVILAGRDLDEIGLIAKDIQVRYGVKATPLYFDALAYDSHASFFNNCLELSDELKGVLLAYGYLGDQKKGEQDFGEAKAIMDVNYTSCVSILTIAANYLEKEKGGFICVLSSVAGDRGRQSNYLYGSAKGALSLYLQGLRNRLAKSGVKVITVKPGFVDTKMTFGLEGMFLVAQPESIAQAINRSIKKSKDVVYTPKFWWAIMTIIKLIPEKIFKRMKL
jgi:decaprenylphospho-beta-D-erythro-pentofuranosid-2-ulose 2-reductase